MARRSDLSYFLSATQIILIIDLLSRSASSEYICERIKVHLDMERIFLSVSTWKMGQGVGAARSRLRRGLGPLMHLERA
jgi:hypothetical protein